MNDKVWKELSTRQLAARWLGILAVSLAAICGMMQFNKSYVMRKIVNPSGALYELDAQGRIRTGAYATYFRGGESAREECNAHVAALSNDGVPLVTNDRCYPYGPFDPDRHQ